MLFRRILSVILAALMLAGSLALGSAAEAMSFDDVAEDAWYYGAVTFVFENGLMQGVSGSEFAPDSQLTRAMFVTIIGRLAGADTENAPKDEFVDTDKNTWYSPYVGWAVENGIVYGFEGNRFAPDDPMTRQQVAAVISRYVKSTGVNLPRENTAPDVFADADKVADWAAADVEVMRRAGIINGTATGEFDPESNITRAATAQIIMNLVETEKKAWQGYIPNIDSDGYAVFGASYLYEGGTALSTTMGHEIDKGSDSYPVLSAYYDEEYAEMQARNDKTVIGLCLTQENIELPEAPVVKIAYRYVGEAEPDTLTGSYRVNPFFAGNESFGASYFTSITENFTFVKGEPDAGFSTATADLTAIAEAHPECMDDPEVLETYTMTPYIWAPGVNSNIDVSHVLVNAFEETYTGDGRFELMYIAFFKTQAEADAFTSADKDDYLKNYFRYSVIDYKESTPSIEEENLKLLQTRIEEILNAESEITPDMFDTDKTYYISSINGDDSNDGKSPETPWKSLSKLEKKLGTGDVVVSSVPKGGAVFFERGSVFYPEVYNNESKTCLGLFGGISYGAYGEGEKPLFTGALDFRSKNGGTGNWLPTEWKNIYVLDEIDAREDFRGQRADIGCIIFDEGAATGVRVYPADKDEPFGPGKLTLNQSFMSNGLTYFLQPAKPCENPGTALTNDLEFLHDFKDGKLYLYCEGGNPSERFDDIKVGGWTYTVTGSGDSIKVDNLAARYSSLGLMSIDGNNVELTNCEVGWSCGSTSSIEGSIGSFGEFENYTISNCYSHDIADGAVTHQNSNDWDRNNYKFKNITYDGNVMLCCGNGQEMWLHSGFVNGAGVAENQIIDCTIKNNIMAYTGMGVPQNQGDRHSRSQMTEGQVYCSYGYMLNCVCEGNTVIFPQGGIYGPHMATDNGGKGWLLRDNTYLVNPELISSIAITGAFDRTNPHSFGFKVTGIRMAFSERTLRFLSSIGIETTSHFYVKSEALTEAEEKGVFYFNGYNVRNMLAERFGK